MKVSAEDIAWNPTDEDIWGVIVKALGELNQRTGSLREVISIGYALDMARRHIIEIQSKAERKEGYGC